MKQRIAALLVAVQFLGALPEPGIAAADGGELAHRIVVAGADEVSSPCTRRAPESGDLIAVPCSERLAGDWGGRLTESSGNTYRVEISLERGGDGAIAYPSLKCSGTLEYLMRRGDAYLYRESISENSKTCGNTAELELTTVSADGSTLDFSWTGANVTVKGRLVGVLTAGATRTSGTSSKPGADNRDECLKYLPNRGAMVETPCESGSETTN